MSGISDRPEERDDPQREPADDARQQPWTGTDPFAAREPGAQPLSDQRVPLPDGVHSGTSDDRPSVPSGDAPSGVRRGLTGPAPPAGVLGAKESEPTMADEGGESSIQQPADPTRVREDVLNTSTSSGMHHDDPGSDDLLKRQLREGHQLPSRMD